MLFHYENKKINIKEIFVSKGKHLLIYFQSDDEMDTSTWDGNQRFTAHVPVPSQQEVEQALLRRRKQELMEKYGAEEGSET